jgi:carbon catabolite-derepressing protein kinase
MMLIIETALKKKSWNPNESDVYQYQGDTRPFAALHLDIQIYEMEHGVYLVDFKCSGYETLDGRLLEEKDVTSPFPFLDMAAKLIMQLAEAD